MLLKDDYMWCLSSWRFGREESSQVCGAGTSVKSAEQVEHRSRTGGGVTAVDGLIDKTPRGASLWSAEIQTKDFWALWISQLSYRTLQRLHKLFSSNVTWSCFCKDLHNPESAILLVLHSSHRGLVKTDITLAVPTEFSAAVGMDRPFKCTAA